jgi:gliding motility-associated-like protein
VNDPPQVTVTIQAVEDTIPFFGHSVQLGVVLQNAAGTGTYAWEPVASLSCTTCSAPVATPVATTVYTLQYIDDNGCSAFGEVTVYVNSDKVFYVPNAFSPNGDGLNDIFQVFSYGVERAVVVVFNRWGEKLYEWNNLAGGWDGTYKGKTVDPGVYIYSAQLRWLDGQVKREKGSITVIR